MQTQPGNPRRPFIGMLREMKGKTKSGPYAKPSGKTSSSGKGKQQGKRLSKGDAKPASGPGARNTAPMGPGSSDPSPGQASGSGARKSAPIDLTKKSFKDTARPGADSKIRFETRWLYWDNIKGEHVETHFFDRSAELWMRPKGDQTWKRAPDYMWDSRRPINMEDPANRDRDVPEARDKSVEWMGFLKFPYFAQTRLPPQPEGSAFPQRRALNVQNTATAIPFGELCRYFLERGISLTFWKDIDDQPYHCKAARLVLFDRSQKERADEAIRALKADGFLYALQSVQSRGREALAARAALGPRPPSASREAQGRRGPSAIATQFAKGCLPEGQRSP